MSIKCSLLSTSPVMGVVGEHLFVGRHGALQKAPLVEVRGQLGEGVPACRLVELRSQQQVLVDANRAADLATLAIDPAQRQVGVDRVGVEPYRAREQLFGPLQIPIENRQQGVTDGRIDAARDACLASAP